MRTLKALFVALVLTATAQAQATCFNFINGKGPSQVGSVALYGPASQVCVEQVSGLGGNQTSVVFSDSQGALAQFSAQVTAVGRCLGFCQILALGYGNANGENVSAAGTNLKFQVEPQGHLRLMTGTLAITDNNGQSSTYLVMKK